MFELFMYVYSCNALSVQFFAVDRILNSYFMIMITYLCTIIHQRHSAELADIWRGKLIGGYMIKIRFK